MAQSVKFGFGQQKEKTKNLASLWNSAALKREHGKRKVISPNPVAHVRRENPSLHTPASLTLHPLKKKKKKGRLMFCYSDDCL